MKSSVAGGSGGGRKASEAAAGDKGVVGWRIGWYWDQKQRGS